MVERTMKTNWYLENKKTPPLGLAFVLLEGALDELKIAINIQDAPYIHTSRVYLSQIVKLYEEAEKKPNWNLLVTPQYLKLGKSILEETDTTLQSASLILSSYLRSAH
jgi:hypothetical protein